MQYTVTVTRPGQPTDDNPARYNDETAALLLRRALRQGLTLTADADTGRITLTDDGRRITLTPAEPLPTWTAAQRREVLALAASPGPIEWEYGRTNVIRLRDWGRECLLTHRTTMTLINGGYLSPVTGQSNPARLSLLAYLSIGHHHRNADKATRDESLAAMLRNVYRQPAPATA